MLWWSCCSRHLVTRGFHLRRHAASRISRPRRGGWRAAPTVHQVSCIGAPCLEADERCPLTSVLSDEVSAPHQPTEPVIRSDRHMVLWLTAFRASSPGSAGAGGATTPSAPKG